MAKLTFKKKNIRFYIVQSDQLAINIRKLAYCLQPRVTTDSVNFRKSIFSLLFNLRDFPDLSIQRLKADYLALILTNLLETLQYIYNNFRAVFT